MRQFIIFLMLKAEKPPSYLSFRRNLSAVFIYCLIIELRFLQNDKLYGY